MTMQQYNQQAQLPTQEQEMRAMSLQIKDASPRPIPAQIMTLDNPPAPIAIENVHSGLSEQVKRFADPSMFETLLNNLGADNTGVNFIKRMSVVPGGIPMFQEPRSGTGQHGATYQELIAVMPLIQQTRRRFTAQFGTQGADRLPDCTAINVTRNRTGDVGFGNPGGWCSVCPHDAFIEGIGRGCRERHAVFALVEGHTLPVYLDMSVYSNRPIMEMLTRMSLESGVEYWQMVVKITLANTQTRTGQAVAVFNAEPIGVIDSSDPDVCAGINNIRRMCHMVLADFAKLVRSSKTVRLNEIDDPNMIESTMLDSTQNMPIPPSMQGQQQNVNDPTRLGLPTPPVANAPASSAWSEPAQAVHPDLLAAQRAADQAAAQLAAAQQAVAAQQAAASMPAAPPVPQMPPPVAPNPGQQLLPPTVQGDPNDAPPLDPAAGFQQQGYGEIQIDPNSGDYLYNVNQQGDPQSNGEF